MPEAPELEVVKDYLVQHLVGQEVTGAQVLRPSVLRSLQGEFEEDIVAGGSRASTATASTSCCR